MYQSLYWSVTEWDCFERSENDFAADNEKGLLMTDNERTAQLFMILDALRTVDNGFVVNTTNAGYKSGYRTVEVNAEVGGEENSYHTQGCAADIHSTTQDYTDEQLAEKVLKKAAELGLQDCLGIGYYGDWIHLDTRGFSARWDG